MFSTYAVVTEEGVKPIKYAKAERPLTSRSIPRDKDNRLSCGSKTESRWHQQTARSRAPKRRLKPIVPVVQNAQTPDSQQSTYMGGAGTKLIKGDIKPRLCRPCSGPTRQKASISFPSIVPPVKRRHQQTARSRAPKRRLKPIVPVVQNAQAPGPQQSTWVWMRAPSCRNSRPL